MSPNPQAVYAVAIVLPACGTIAVALRFYVRKITRKVGLKSDDWTIFVALILTWILGIILIVGAAIDSFGNHTQRNPKTGGNIVTYREQNSSKLHFSAYLVMIPAFAVIKVSILLLYRRIFIGRIFNYYTIAMCILIICWSLAFFLATAFQCGTKIEYWWTSTKTIQTYCFDTAELELAYGVSDVITDLMVLVTPIPIIWKLQMSSAQKVALSGVFLLGFLSTAAGVVRLVQVIVNIYDTTTGYRDLIGVLTNVVIWSHVEAGVAVIAACLPTLKPLVHGRAAESVVNSLRSALSLHSVNHSREHNPQAEDSGTLVGSSKAFDLESVRKSSSSHLPSTYNTHVVGNAARDKDSIPDVPDIPDDAIAQRTGFAVTAADKGRA